jgi:hypothetical protein
MSRFILYRVPEGAAQFAEYAGGSSALSAVKAVSDKIKCGEGADWDHSGFEARTDRGSVKHGAEADSHYVCCGEYVLRYSGSGYRLIGETGIYIGGYLLPRNTLFQGYGNAGQHELVSRLYAEHGRSFTDHVKGRFVVIIMKDGRVEIYFDHLGLYRAFYHISGTLFMISDTVRQLEEAGAPREPDRVSLAMQALFNRVTGKYTVYNDILKTTGADCFILEGNEVSHTHYFSPVTLAENGEDIAEPGIESFAQLFSDNVRHFNSFLGPQQSFITLTGGKDSRTILAALLGAGIRPEGITYGNKLSRDAIYAAMLAEKAGIRHTVITPPATEEWFASEARAIIDAGDPEINIHRSLRRHAFETASYETGKNCAFYTGYMGGEFLMGIFHDDLIFTGFLRDLWNGSHPDSLTEERLRACFIRSDREVLSAVRERIGEMACTDMALSHKMREFHAIFEIGIPHHTQDITLSSLFWDYPCPLYLDIEFLELLFKSRYSFLFRNASTRSPFRRHALFSLNMGIQHLLFTELDSVPFGKRGSYNNSEYLRGTLFWSLVKGYRFLTERKKYPPSFAYRKEYGAFISGVLSDAVAAESPLNEFYDVPGAVAGLEKLVFPLQEKYLHRYSAIAALHMMFSDRG